EQAGESRPVLVVSNDLANNVFRVVTVVPLTSMEGKTRKPHAFEIKLPKGTVDNEVQPFALPHQIRSIAKERLLRKGGELADDFARGYVEDALLAHLGIDLEG
ncbi:MAG TPA: type II toxin-antitoxin system PemK/MazF family toxin, partial [Longimicrobium sp.]|nr:type II toxin-antitoxin system PemK/MazF family toxin [Longimicrobium sp.]